MKQFVWCWLALFLILPSGLFAQEAADEELEAPKVSLTPAPQTTPLVPENFTPDHLKGTWALGA